LAGGKERRIETMKPDRLTRLAYGLGAVPFGAKLQLFGLLLLFYNQLLGLPAAAVSAIIAASVVLDAVWDPFVGQFSDTTRSRWGRRHPYLYGVALPLALAFALLWRPPAGWSQPALLAWLAVFAILTRLLVSLHEIPSAALMPELARGYDERTALVGLRYIFGNVGAGISFVLAFGIFLRSTSEHPFGQLNRSGYAPFGATIAGLMLVTILLSALGTHRVIPRLYAPRARAGGIGQRLRAIGQTLRSRNFAVIAVAGMLHGINLGIHGGLAIYFTTYYWQLPAEKLLWLGLLSGPAHPLAAVFAPVLAKRWGKRDACVGLFLAAIALGNLPLVAGLLGWMPAAGSIAQFAILLADLSVVTFIGTSGFIIVTSMVADIVEETELRTGRRSEGLLLAADTFLQKLSAGTAIAVPGLLLALVAFPPHADPATLDPEVMRRLAFISLPLWVALGVAATSVLLFYRIDRSTHEANLAKLTPETDGSIPPIPHRSAPAHPGKGRAPKDRGMRRPPSGLLRKRRPSPTLPSPASGGGKE
jgi:glycoside/pentoside/hexuronide:cation symporter, GPH family